MKFQWVFPFDRKKEGTFIPELYGAFYAIFSLPSFSAISFLKKLYESVNLSIAFYKSGGAFHLFQWQQRRVFHVNDE